MHINHCSDYVPLMLSVVGMYMRPHQNTITTRTLDPRVLQLRLDVVVI